MGFDTNLFVDEVPDYLLCPVCLDAIEDPTVVCEGGHSLCKGCFEDCKSKPTNNDKCPECARKMFEKGVPILGLSHAVMGLAVCCPHKGEGDGAPKCEWTGKLEEHIDRHCKTGCCFLKEACSLCQEMIPLPELGEHKKNSCPRRLVDCPHCKAFVEAKELGTVTTNAASKVQVFTGHLKECTRVRIDCPYTCFGCDIKMTRACVVSHLSEFAEGHNQMISRGLQGSIPKADPKQDRRAQNSPGTGAHGALPANTGLFGFLSTRPTFGKRPREGYIPRKAQQKSPVARKTLPSTSRKRKTYAWPSLYDDYDDDDFLYEQKKPAAKKHQVDISDHTVVEILSP